MTETFTASNGIEFRYGDFGQVLGSAQRFGGREIIVVGAQYVDALREFFRAEEDERLGRWRSAVDPSWTAVRRSTVVYFQNEDHERSFNVVLAVESSLLAWTPDLQAIGREYFDAHPEPKQWLLQTQESGSGAWFTITEYTPGTQKQQDRAKERAEALIALGLYARVIAKESGD